MATTMRFIEGIFDTGLKSRGNTRTRGLTVTMEIDRKLYTQRVERTVPAPGFDSHDDMLIEDVAEVIAERSGRDEDQITHVIGGSVFGNWNYG